MPTSRPTMSFVVYKFFNLFSDFIICKKHFQSKQIKEGGGVVKKAIQFREDTSISKYQQANKTS